MIGEAKKKARGVRTRPQKEVQCERIPIAHSVHWLADLYLLSTVLLLVGLAVMYRFKQPSRRMAVARSVAAGLVAWPCSRPLRAGHGSRPSEWQPTEPGTATPQVETPAARLRRRRASRPSRST